MLTFDTLIQLAPYPGLRSFEKEERQYFFGRERQLDELLRKLRSNRFLAVSGTAGSGKSSLVKAALVPRLRDGFAGQAGTNWRVAVCTIGNNPIGNLAKQLAQRAVLHPDEMMDPNYPATVEAMLRRGSLGIVEAFKQSGIKRENLMIVVDQFEDIFRYAQRKGTATEEEAAAFVSLLLNASRQKDFPVYIVLTMRSSALGQCTEFRGLTEAINDGQFLMPRMKLEDFKKAIIAPAAQAGVVVDGALVNQIISDANEEYDDLAALQHVMMRAWENWVGSEKDYEKTPLGIKHYAAVGGLNDSLHRHAEEAYAEVNEEESNKRQICERMFKGLSENGPEGKPIRRPMTVKEIMTLTEAPFNEVRLVVHIFSQTGRQFLNAPDVAAIDEDTVVTIAHECLLTRWKRLNEWVKEENESADLYRRIAADAALYNKGEGSLYADPELTIGLKWAKPAQFELPALPPTKAWADRYHPAFVETIKFLEDSEAEHNAALGRVEYEQNRRMRSATLIAAGSALFGLVCVLLLGVALIAIRSANKNAKEAYQSAQESQRLRYLSELRKQESDANAAISKMYAARALAESEKAANATTIALKATTEALKSEKAALDEKARAEKEKAAALEAKRIADEQRLLANQEREKANQEREKAIAATNTALRIKGLSLAQSIAVKSLDVTDENVEALLAKEAHALNKVNKGKPYDAYVYKALYEAVDNLNNRFNSLQDAPEGVKRIGTVRAIVVKDSFIYSTGSEGYLLQWKNKTFEKFADHRKAENLPQIIGHDPAVYRAMVLTPDGKNLVRGGENLHLQVFDPAQPGTPPRVIQQEGFGKITSIVMLPKTDASKEPTFIFSATDGTLQMASLGDKKAKIIAKDLYDVIKMAVTSDGQYLFCVGENDRPVILNLGQDAKENTVKKEVVLMDKFAVANNAANQRLVPKATAVAASPNGKYVAIGYSNGGVRIWDFERIASTGWYVPEMRVFHTATIHDLAFSPNSAMLGAASMDKAATLWTIEGRDEYTGENIQPFTDEKFVPIKLSDHADWVMSVAFSPDNTRMFTGTQNGVIKIWETNMDLYADEICRRVQANLSDNAWRKYIGTDDETNRELYILIPDGGRRTPLSTCGGNFDQMRK